MSVQIEASIRDKFTAAEWEDIRSVGRAFMAERKDYPVLQEHFGFLGEEFVGLVFYESWFAHLEDRLEHFLTNTNHMIYLLADEKHKSECVLCKNFGQTENAAVRGIYVNGKLVSRYP